MTDIPNTKLIPLTQGKFAIVDEDDYDFLTQWKWSLSGRYARTVFYPKDINGKLARIEVLMHKILMGDIPGKITDHINNNSLDNRRCNLREATLNDNARNKIKYKDSISKYKGLSWSEERKNWHVKISVNDKTINLGRFKDEEYAALVYDIWAMYYFGDFAKTNKMLGLL